MNRKVLQAIYISNSFSFLTWKCTEEKCIIQTVDIYAYLFLLKLMPEYAVQIELLSLFIFKTFLKQGCPICYLSSRNYRYICTKNQNSWYGTTSIDFVNISCDEYFICTFHYGHKKGLQKAVFRPYTNPIDNGNNLRLLRILKR